MNQPKAYILKKLVDELYPHLEVPDEVREFRPFYEGVLAFNATKGDKLKAYHGYRKDAFHAKDWEGGWEAAKGYVNRKQQFKFMECVA